MDFGSGFDSRTYSRFPLPLPISEGYQEPFKERVYESFIYHRHPASVGGHRHDFEQHRTCLRSTPQFTRTRSYEKTGSGKGDLPKVLQSPENAIGHQAEKGWPV